MVNTHIDAMRRSRSPPTGSSRDACPIIRMKGSLVMNPKQNSKPSHEDRQDKYDRDRDGEPSGVNQVNPLNTENQGGDPAPALDEQGGDPAKVRPQQAHVNRNKRSQPDFD